MRILSNIALMLISTGIAVWAADTKAGQSVYARACQSCHGPNGAGVAAAAKMLKAEIRDLKVATKTMSDADVRKIVVEGKGKMVATKGVAGADLDSVIAYVRTLK